jgi:hypothetical protein
MVGTMDCEDVMMAFSFNIGWCIFVTQDKVELEVVKEKVGVPPIVSVMVK